MSERQGKTRRAWIRANLQASISKETSKAIAKVVRRLKKEKGDHSARWYSGPGFAGHKDRASYLAHEAALDRRISREQKRLFMARESTKAAQRRASVALKVWLRLVLKDERGEPL